MGCISSEVQVGVFVEDIIGGEADGVLREAALVLIQTLAVVGRMLDEAAAVVLADVEAALAQAPMVFGLGWVVSLLVSHESIYISFSCAKVPKISVAF